MNKKSNDLYMSDVVESEKKSCEYGDSQVLIAGEKDRTPKVENEKVGNQSKEYYQK